METITMPSGAKKWLAKGEHGLSSKTIFSCLSGLVITDHLSHPSDPDDFNRCSMLIDMVPEWRSRLSELNVLGKPWPKIVEHWDKLEAMLPDWREDCRRGTNRVASEMYALMKSIGC